MHDQNVEMLENIISAAVNTRYKEIPPTEEEFNALTESMRQTFSANCPITDDEFSCILLRLHSYLVIKMEVGIYIDDRNRPHKSWLPARRADLDFYFWKRYKKYLEENNHWNPRVTATLDKVSDEIVDLLGDPKSEQNFQRRGLVLGDVQSGKTANYTAICNKAADTGYRVIIILAGMMENLRKQTQSRLDAEFSGRMSEYYLDPKLDQEIKNRPVGVGKYGNEKRIASFTSVTKDFNINLLKSNDLAIKSVSDPVLLVVKKNKSILNNLFKWLIKNNADPYTKKIMLPMLLIDDEADNASVNTKKEEDSPAAINECIRKILNCFNQTSYLGITATPFANIFINPDSQDEMVGDDLFPKDFIYSLSPPTNYIGADKIFGVIPDYAGVLIPIINKEMEPYFPFSHKKDMDVDALPNSMYEAMAYFLLINIVRDLRGDQYKHRSMMIHVSRFTDVQNNIAELINEWLMQVKSDCQNYASLPSKKSDRISNINYLRMVWEKYELEKLCGKSWDFVCSKSLYRSIAPIDVRAVNQTTGATSLDYFNHKDDGLRVIAVGGNSLSRGLTLEGLAVSYFYRRSQMYDTLMQMGRWFGYRPNYDDLFKVWMAEEAIDWYGYITEAGNELKNEIAKMKLENQTPSEFGLKVRQDPNSLIATAKNKMRFATKVKRPVSVSGKLLETPRLKVDPEILSNNEQVVKSFICSLAEEGIMDTLQKKYYWRGVSKELVAQLLLDFESHPWHLAFQGRALSEFIEQKMGDEKWDVALITDGDGRAYPEGLIYGDDLLEVKSTQRRKVIADEKMIRISGTKVRVGSGGCTRVGLSSKEIEIAEHRFKDRHGNKNLSDSAYLIRERNPLLMLHIVEIDRSTDEPLNIVIPEFLFALGVGFPETGEGNITANYVVNMVELKNWMDIDEDDEE